MELTPQEIAEARDTVQNHQYRDPDIKYASIRLVGGVLDGIRTVINRAHDAGSSIGWVVGESEDGPVISTYRHDEGCVWRFERDECAYGEICAGETH